LVGIEDGRRRISQGLLQCSAAKASLQGIRQTPRQHISAEPVHHGHQIQKTVAHGHIGDINGMIANDKFCFVRPAHLQLTAVSGVEVYRQRNPRLPSGYAPDESVHQRGSHEDTTVAHSASDNRTPRWPATLGSGLPVPPALDSDWNVGVDTDQLPTNTGGTS
jgi:hypothetical protein